METDIGCISEGMADNIKTLAEALLVKKELIKQAERDFGEVIYKD